MTKLETLKEQILEVGGNPETVLFQTPDYVEAFLGLSHDGRAIYSYDRMVESLINDGMDTTEAMEFIEFNTIRALSYHLDSPIILMDGFEVKEVI